MAPFALISFSKKQAITVGGDEGVDVMLAAEISHD